MANKISLPNKNDDSEFDPNETLNFMFQIKTDTQKSLLTLSAAYKDIRFIDNNIELEMELAQNQEILEKNKPDNSNLIERLQMINQINNLIKTSLVMLFEMSQELVQRLEKSKTDSNPETMRVLTQASEIDFIITKLVQYAKKIGYIEIGEN